MSDETTKDGNFINRWSQRKTAERDNIPEQPVAALPADAVAETPENDEAAIDLEDLPDIDTLDKDSDYTVFMKKGVPEELKRLALRKLFHSDPALSVLDGLNDYDEDYSMLGMVAEEITTRYKAGKGMVDPEDEIVAEEEAAAEVVESEAPEQVEMEEPDKISPEDIEPTGADDNDDELIADDGDLES